MRVVYNAYHKRQCRELGLRARRHLTKYQEIMRRMPRLCGVESRPAPVPSSGVAGIGSPSAWDRAQEFFTRGFSLYSKSRADQAAADIAKIQARAKALEERRKLVEKQAGEAPAYRPNWPLIGIGAAAGVAALALLARR